MPLCTVCVCISDFHSSVYLYASLSLSFLHPRLISHTNTSHSQKYCSSVYSGLAGTIHVCICVYRTVQLWIHKSAIHCSTFNAYDVYVGKWMRCFFFFLPCSASCIFWGCRTVAPLWSKRPREQVWKKIVTKGAANYYYHFLGTNKSASYISKLTKMNITHKKSWVRKNMLYFFFGMKATQTQISGCYT